MPTEVIMPKVDMDMAQGTLACWHATEGSKVKKGAPLFDIETDKANMEIEAPASGVLRDISAHNGDVVAIGTCVAKIYSDGEEYTGCSTSGSDKITESSVQNNIRSSGNESIQSSDLATERSRVDYPVKTGDSNPDLVAGRTNQTIRATPSARRLARKHQLELESIMGSGPRGRVDRSDVENVVAKQTSQHFVSAQSATSALQSSLERYDALGVAYTRRPVSGMRKTIARRLTQSKSSIPHFYLETECRVDKLIRFRREINSAKGDSFSVKVTLNDLIVKSCAHALIAVPETSVSWLESEIIQFKHANIAIAVAVDGGLLTPVVREIDNKTLSTLSTELSQLVIKARNNKLTPQECQGASMSVSNLGMYGITGFGAIINPPESMILAVGTVRNSFVADLDHQPLMTQVMSVTLSCDHRVIDGAVGAQWLEAFREAIENPTKHLYQI